MSRLIKGTHDCVMLQLQIYEWKLLQEVALNHPTWLASQGQSPWDFCALNGSTLPLSNHFSVITIKAHSASTNRDWSDARSSPWHKPSIRAFGQKIPSKATIGGRGGLKLVLLAHDRTAGHQPQRGRDPPSVLRARPANRAAPPAPSSPCSSALCHSL